MALPSQLLPIHMAVTGSVLLPLGGGGSSEIPSENHDGDRVPARPTPLPLLPTEGGALLQTFVTNERMPRLARARTGTQPEPEKSRCAVLTV